MGGVHREENLEHQRCLYLHRKWPLKRPHLECPDFGFPRPSSDVPKESFELGSDMLVEPKSNLHITLWETILKLWILTMIPTKPVMLIYLTFFGTTMIHAQKIKKSSNCNRNCTCYRIYGRRELSSKIFASASSMAFGVLRNPSW